MRARVLFLLAAACFAAAFAFPFWKMTLVAPQYPDGLRVSVGVEGLGGDVREVNGLNHYIGMKKLEHGAVVELAIAPYGLAAFVALALAAAFVRRRWIHALLLAAVAFPVVFLADLSFWLWYFGHTLDPHAALSSSIKPFTPLALFWSHVGQFRIYAMVQAGFTLSAIGSVLVAAALLLRRSERPLPEVARAPAGPTAKHALPLAGALIAALLGAPDARAFDLQAAIDRTPPGATLRIPAGTHAGSFTVRRPLTLEPAGPPGSVTLDGRGRGNVLRIIAPDVTVRGLRLRGSGASADFEDAGIAVFAPRARIERNVIEDALFGIDLRGAAGSVVAGNRITGKDLPLMRRGDGIKLWASPGARVERNTISRTSDLVVWYSANVILRRNVARDSRYGIHFMYSSDSLLEGNVLTDNRVGAFLMNSKRLVVRDNLFARNRGPSGYGLGLKDIDGLTLEGNRFVANRVGLYIANSPNDLGVTHAIRRNIVAYNDVGIAFLPDVKRNVFTQNAFVENAQQALVLGGGSFRGNTFARAGRGNYWSDYVGWDAARDGVGDVPYRMSSLFGEWLERDPRLRLFDGGLAAWTIDFAARTFPVFRPETRIADQAPLTSAPRLPAGPAAAGPGPSVLAPAVLLALAGLIVAFARRAPGVPA